MKVYVSLVVSFVVFFFKQKTAYEMRISDWSSDVCSSDLRGHDICPRARRDLEMIAPIAHLDPRRRDPATNDRIVSQWRDDERGVPRVKGLQRRTVEMVVMIVRQQHRIDLGPGAERAAESRVGKECVRRGIAGWSP